MHMTLKHPMKIIGFVRLPLRNKMSSRVKSAEYHLYPRDCVFRDTIRRFAVVDRMSASVYRRVGS